MEESVETKGLKKRHPAMPFNEIPELFNALFNWKREDIRNIWKLPEIYRAEPVVAELLEKLHEIIVKFVYLGEFVVKSLMFPLEKS